jgi:diguanylate cyclase (GGDEF)-like protein
MATTAFHLLSLRVRLILLVALAAAPMLCAILYDAYEQGERATLHAESEVLRLARSAAAEHRRIIGDARKLLTLLAKQPEVRGLDPTACSTFVRRFLDEGGPYANLGAIAADGNVICSALPLERPFNVVDRPVFRQTVSTRRFTVGGYMMGHISKMPVIVTGFPILDEQGGAVGVAFAAISLQWLNNLISNAQLPPQSMTTVVDSQLRVLARWPGDDWIGQPVGDTPLGRELAIDHQDRVVHSTDLGGKERLYGITHLTGDTDQAQAHVAIGVADNVALAETRSLLRRNLIAFALVTLLLFTIAWWGGSVLVIRQLKQLVNVSGELERGNLGARAPELPGQHEIAQLCRAYNRMADALQRRNQDIQAHTEEIDRLNRIHAVLSATNAAVLRVQERQALLDEICRIAVNEGKFVLALVSEHDNGSGAVRPLASAGADEATVARLHGAINRSNAAARQLPTAQTLHDGRTTVAAASDLEQPEVGDIFAALGVGACAAFPLQVEGKVVASLTLHAAETDFFDHEELKLLQVMAADASFGLDYLEKEQHRRYLAFFDPLTDLPNRYRFHDELTQQLKTAENNCTSLAVLVLGLRSFRRINDTLGRHVGDSVLRQSARALRQVIEPQDMLARIGNDEFAVALPADVTGTQLSERTSRILAAAPRKLQIQDQEVYVGWNGGVALYPLDATDPQTLIKHAELASHSSVRSDSGGLLFYSPTLDTQARRRYEIELGLREAASRGELSLHYQPVVDVHSGRTSSVEALLRWNSHELGALPAASFIPVAEETGLIVPLGEWAIARACQQALTWQSAGHRTVSIALNVSVKQLQQHDFADRLLEIIRGAGCDPASTPLAIEVTESELMHNVKSSAEVLTRIKKAGLSIYVDDFGTGYSSLSYLHQLPIDVLKIDRSFIQGIVGNPRTLATVKAIIVMAHNLGLRVIAEGVEEAAELQILRDIHCDAIQGYLVSVPCSGDSLQPLLGTALLQSA